MTLLVVGISHRSAPMEVLESAGMAPATAHALAAELIEVDAVAEAMVLVTCNRIEVYAEVSRFHPVVAAATELLAKFSAADRTGLGDHMYVHFDSAAVSHLFSVAAGLDSMVVGEAQILGQLRTALTSSQELGTAGRGLNGVVQQALRVGKRVQTETGIDRSGVSVVSVALDAAEQLLGPLEDRRVLVVGAGSMGALTLAGLAERGVAQVTVASRSLDRASDTAAVTAARYVEMAEVEPQIAASDVAVYATGALGTVLDAQRLQRLLTPGQELLILDLALPHDVDPDVKTLAGVRRIDLADVAGMPSAAASQAQAAAAREIVAEEVGAFLDLLAGQQVEPVLISLRKHVGQVLDLEMQRLRLRLSGMDDATLAEVERAMRRAMATLLHNPTVRMKEFAAQPGGDRYAEALSALFDLDPAIPQSVTGSKPDGQP